MNAPQASPAEIVPFAAGRDPHKVALVTSDRRMTYAELESASRQVAVALRRRGVADGDVVSIYGQNCWQWIVSYHGALRAGAVVNPVNVMLTGPELEHVISDCEAKVVMAGAEQSAVAVRAVDAVDTAALCVSLAADGVDGALGFGEFLAEGSDGELVADIPATGDLCSIGYTSGTTGHPKGALQSHQAVLLNCAFTATMHGRVSSDVMVTALPAAHVYGNVAINSIFLVGGTVVLMERFDVPAALELIQTERATMFEGVPAMYSMLLAHHAFASADLSSLRCATVGGQTFSPKITTGWEAHTGVRLVELWGMTEIAGLGATHSVHAPVHPGSIGVSLPGMQLKVAAPGGATGEAEAGEQGELLIRGPLVMLGYWRRPDATAEVLDKNGWLRTGDVAVMDHTGHLFIVDRVKDMLVTAGYNVYPAEIERVLGAHPDVAMVGVGRRADDIRGEVAVAFVVARHGVQITEDDVLAFCRPHLAAYKRPRAVVFVDQLPLTPSGKIMRHKLADLDVAAPS
jgi:long-chain acyl-CoA synthetase